MNPHSSITLTAVTILATALVNSPAESRATDTHSTPAPTALHAGSPLFARVKDIIVKQLGVKPEQVIPQASFSKDLGADSLDTVELVMAFEEEYKIEIPDEHAEKLQTVGATIHYLEEKRAARKSSAARGAK